MPIMNTMNIKEPGHVTKLSISQLLNGADDTMTGTDACDSAPTTSELAGHGEVAFATSNDTSQSSQHDMNDEGRPHALLPFDHPQVALPKKAKRAPMSKEQQKQAIFDLEAKLAQFQSPLPPAKPYGTLDAAFEDPHSSIGHETDVEWRAGDQQPHIWDAESVMRGNILHNASRIEETLFRLGQDESYRGQWPLNAPNVLVRAPVLGTDVFDDGQWPLSSAPGPISDEEKSLGATIANIAPPISSIGQDLGHHPTPSSNYVPSGKKRKSSDEVKARGRPKADASVKTKRARKDEITRKLSKAQAIMDQLIQLGVPFEQSLDNLSNEVGHALLKGGDDGSAIEQLRAIGTQWKQSNRGQLVKIASFLERNAVLPVGGLELPTSSLDVAERADSVIVVDKAVEDEVEF